MERKEEGETAKMDRNPGAPPLYAQLEQILKQQIECGTYKKGDFLPTEKELMEKYELEGEICQVQVSRSRKAGAYHLMQGQNPVNIISFDLLSGDKN